MRESFLELLECPVCHSSLHIESASMEADRIRSGALVYGQQHSYPIREFIPVFAHMKPYMSAFSSLRQTPAGQLTKSGELDVEKITRVDFIAQTLTSAQELHSKTVLDAGCGDGRFVRLLANHGVRIVGIDIDGVGVGRVGRRLADNKDAHFAQADLFHLPFRPGAFDFIFSLGVLHHTPDPKAAFLILSHLLKAGGQIAVWIYPKSERTAVSDLLRPITTRMPTKSLYWIARVVTSIYGPFLRIPRIKGRLQAILYSTRLPWHDEKHWRIHSFLDWYGPRYQFNFSPEELEAWFSEAGLVEVVRCPNESSVRGRAALSRALVNS